MHKGGGLHARKKQKRPPITPQLFSSSLSPLGGKKADTHEQRMRSPYGGAKKEREKPFCIQQSREWNSAGRKQRWPPRRPIHRLLTHRSRALSCWIGATTPPARLIYTVNKTFAIYLCVVNRNGCLFTSQMMSFTFNDVLFFKKILLFLDCHLSKSNVSFS